MNTDEEWLEDSHGKQRKFVDKYPNFKIKRTFKQWLKDILFPVNLDDFRKAKGYVKTDHELLK